MANTFGQSKANEASASENNKNINPADCGSKDSDHSGEKSWRPTDAPLESATDAEFDETEEKTRQKQIHTDSPGVTPDIAE